MSHHLTVQVAHGALFASVGRVPPAPLGTRVRRSARRGLRRSPR